MKRSDQRRRQPPLPTNRPRSGLEGNTAYVLFVQGATQVGRIWINLGFSPVRWINNAGLAVRWN